MNKIMFCLKCGGEVKNINLDGDNFARDVCIRCGNIHYINPKIIVGSLPVLNNRVLLCKRSIHPGHGKWTIPSGYMEMGESLEDGAKRESREEANLKLEMIMLYGNYSIPKLGQVLFVFLGRIKNDNFSAAAETLEVKLFKLEDIPWQKIAFPSVSFFLNRYVEEYKAGKNFQYHSNYSNKYAPLSL